jgi:alcohol dehydrogenase
MLSMMEAGKIAPQKLIGKRVTLDEAIAVLTSMDATRDIGISVIDRF